MAANYPVVGRKAARDPLACANYKIFDTGSGNLGFFVAQVPFKKGGVTYREVRSDGGEGPVVDVQDVEIEGYASTFNNLDRDGETFLPGAFKEDISNFMLNPVMLKDHWNKCDNVVGRFLDVREDSKGLRVHGRLSNSPDNLGIRFKVYEGMIKTFSVAGLFHFNETHSQIFKAHIWEVSLIPIPSNPKALFEYIKGQKHLSQEDGRNPELPGSSGGNLTKPTTRFTVGGLTVRI